MNQRAKDRTLGQRLVDLQWTKYARLPAATSDYAVSEFTYDPAKPTPTYGGPLSRRFPRD
jgi:hypothetical protein